MFHKFGGSYLSRTPCPVNPNVSHEGKCPAHQCQHNIQGMCCYREMTSQEPVQFLVNHGYLERAEKAAKRVKAYVYVDRYCLYALNKSIMQIDKEELKSLMVAERFYAWPGAKQGMFWVIEAIYNDMFVPKKPEKKNVLTHPTFRSQVESKYMLRC